MKVRIRGSNLWQFVKAFSRWQWICSNKGDVRIRGSWIRESPLYIVRLVIITAFAIKVSIVDDCRGPCEHLLFMGRLSFFKSHRRGGSTYFCKNWGEIHIGSYLWGGCKPWCFSIIMYGFCSNHALSQQVFHLQCFFF